MNQPRPGHTPARGRHPRRAVYSRFTAEPPTPPDGWYLACPDAYVGPYPSAQTAHDAATGMSDCPWPHHTLHLPENSTRP